jgi:hypothetical protein
VPLKHDGACSFQNKGSMCVSTLTLLALIHFKHFLLATFAVDVTFERHSGLLLYLNFQLRSQKISLQQTLKHMQNILKEVMATKGTSTVAYCEKRLSTLEL